MKLKQAPIVSFLLGLSILISCKQSTTNNAQSLSATNPLFQVPTSTSTAISTLVRTLTPASTITRQPTATFTPTYLVNPNSLFLSDMQPYINPENIYGDLALDRVFWQPEIWVNGKYYAKGLGMHPPPFGVGFVGYKVPKEYTLFASLAGLAWQDGNPGCETVGDARFRVYVNNELEFGSEVVRFGSPLVIEIAVKEGDILRLEVDNGEDDYECDHATWAEARFEP